MNDDIIIFDGDTVERTFIDVIFDSKSVRTKQGTFVGQNG